MKIAQRGLPCKSVWVIYEVLRILAHPAMMDQVCPLLLIEQDQLLSAQFAKTLRGAGFVVHDVESLAAAEAALAADSFPLVLLDLDFPAGAGTAFLKTLMAEPQPPEVLVLTANGSISVAVAAMRDGAYDFLLKPVAPEKLVVTAKNASEHRRLKATVEILHQAGRPSFAGFIGTSPAMQAVYKMIESAAASKATVFITGESGTGKEVCAEAIHHQSPRGKKPFLALNCAAIPKDLIESEIFGHVKGAFTGATSDREGAAQRADGGTLFLDEICEMDLNLQSKLLRFLQTGTFQRVGGSKLEKVDARILCATNRDPWAEVEAGRFREDLYYRLHVVPIALPPLRERGQDILELATTFLTSFAREEKKQFTGFSPEAEQVFLHYDWPGNVRQLQNVVRNIVVLNDAPIVDVGMIPPPVGGRWARPNGFAGVARKPVTLAAEGAMPTIKPLAVVEREAIENAIAVCDGNIPKAAVLLGVSPSTIYRKLTSWGVMT